MTNEQWNAIDELIHLGLEWLNERGETVERMDKYREASRSLDAIRTKMEPGAAGEKS